VVTNRAEGINEQNATWITFHNPTANCTAGIDYNWVYSKEYTKTQCFDVYTLNIDWLFAVEYCGVGQENISNGFEYTFVIDILTREFVYVVSDGVFLNTTRLAYSQEGYIIQVQNTVFLSSNTLLNVYAPIYIAAVIYEYYIPLGDTPKTIYIETTIQDPNNQGFELYLPGSSENLTQLSGTPSPELQAIPATIVPLDDGNCTDSNPDGLCIQRWLVTISVQYGICQLLDAVYQINYGIKCVDGVDPTACPITNTTDSAVVEKLMLPLINSVASF